MKDLLNKYCASEIRDIKKRNPKMKPIKNNLSKTEIFKKSYFGKKLK